MVFQKEDGVIFLEDEKGKRVAEIDFPETRPGVVEIIRTKVDPSLAGQGIAGKMTHEVVEQLRREGKKAVPVCSYAVQWFSRHPEYHDVLETADLRGTDA